MVNYEKQEDREDLFQEVAREAADRLGPAFTDVIGNGGDRYNSCVLRSEANGSRLPHSEPEWARADVGCCGVLLQELVGITSRDS